eukprot:1789064-Amphidinium_carterae.1
MKKRRLQKRSCTESAALRTTSQPEAANTAAPTDPTVQQTSAPTGTAWLAQPNLCDVLGSCVVADMQRAYEAWQRPQPMLERQKCQRVAIWKRLIVAHVVAPTSCGQNAEATAPIGDNVVPHQYHHRRIHLEAHRVDSMFYGIIIRALSAMLCNKIQHTCCHAVGMTLAINR